MNLNVTVNVSEHLQATLDSLAEGDYITEAAQGIYDFLKAYHTEFADKWRGPNWIPSAQSGQFAQNVIDGWQEPELSGNTATITNTFGLLAWKVSGGTIVPKQAKMLAIPLTVAAKENPPASFPSLFIVGNTLSLSLGRGRSKTIVAQYALAKSVTQQPWPGAMPDDDAIAEAGAMALSEAIQEKTGE